MRFKKQALAVGSLVAIGGALVACGDNESDNSATDSSAATTAAESSESSATSAADVAFEDAYCKAKQDEDDMPDDAMGEMTGCFGNLVNNSDKDITVTGFTIKELAQDDDVKFEMHETVNGSMQQKQGGFTIAPGETLELAPGGNHLMVMDYEDAIPAGEDLTFTFQVDGADSVETTVPVREVAAGNEGYHGGDMDEMDDMDDMDDHGDDMDDMDDHDDHSDDHGDDQGDQHAGH